MLISLSLVPLDDGPRSTGYFDSAQHKSGTGILVFGVGGRGQPHHSVWRYIVLRQAQHKIYYKLDELIPLRGLFLVRTSAMLKSDFGIAFGLASVVQDCGRLRE